MRLSAFILLAALAATCTADDQPGLWSWGGNTEESKATKQTYALESNVGPSSSGPESAGNETLLTVDEVIDTILSSNRQGRNLDGFDEVYSDPTVQDAIQKGDDSQARNLIKDKLCTLGLMQCDTEESVEGKRPFLAGEYIYAQPPNNNGPYRGPPRQPNKFMYGPPRPMPNNFGPPRKVGYVGSSSRPIYSSLPGPIISSGPPLDFQGPIYHSKPPGPIYEGNSPPYKFEPHPHGQHHGHEEHHEFSSGLINPKPAIVEGSASTVNIHHHYHHNTDEGTKTQVIPVPVPASNSLGAIDLTSSHGSSGFDYQNFKQSSGLNTFGSSGGFSGSNGYGNGVKPVFESVNNFDSGSASFNSPAVFGTPGSQGLGASISSFGQSSGLYNGNGGSFHSGNPDYYKKALGGGSSYNALNSNQQLAGGYAGQYGNNFNAENYQSLESARQDNFDCVCVPFDQCPARDVFGRKGDLILPLDPRNLGTDIEALNDDDNSNSTSAARVPKEAKTDEIAEATDDEKEAAKDEIEPAENEKKISKREISDKKSDDIDKADGEAVSSIF